MRASLLLLAIATPAAAEVRVGAAVGAGGQGDASYGALEARLDAETSRVRLGLGARAVWLDGELRQDFARPIDAIRIVRLFELAAWEGGLALAAGGLAPSQLAHVADGHRAALDDRPRTGVRAALTGESLALALELDDALDPSLAGGMLAWAGTRWVGRGAAAVDPALGEAAIELSLARRWQRDDARLELGGGGVSEPGFGLAALAFADATIDHGSLRFTGNAELRLPARAPWAPRSGRSIGSSAPRSMTTRSAGRWRLRRGCRRTGGLAACLAARAPRQRRAAHRLGGRTGRALAPGRRLVRHDSRRDGGRCGDPDRVGAAVRQRARGRADVRD